MEPCDSELVRESEQLTDLPRKIIRSKGRPRKISRELIVQKAMDIARLKPEREVSLGEIARQLNVTTSALYRHVKDKRDLGRFLAIEAIESAFQRVELEDSADWQGTLAKSIDNFRLILSSNPIILRSISHPAFLNSPDVLEIIEQIQAMLTKCLLSPVDVLISQHILLNYVVGSAFMSQTHSPDHQEISEQTLFEVTTSADARKEYPLLANSIQAVRGHGGMNFPMIIKFLITLFADRIVSEAE